MAKIWTEDWSLGPSGTKFKVFQINKNKCLDTVNISAGGGEGLPKSNLFRKVEFPKCIISKLRSFVYNSNPSPYVSMNMLLPLKCLELQVLAWNCGNLKHIAALELAKLWLWDISKTHEGTSIHSGPVYPPAQNSNEYFKSYFIFFLNKIFWYYSNGLDHILIIFGWTSWTYWRKMEL